MLCGPSKVTLNYVRATGDDPSTRKTNEDSAESEQSLSGGYMKPWGYLMYFLYGTGDGWDASGHGQPTNLHHVGARLDYAVAANLNLSLVYAQAWRDQPNAYWLGGDWAYQGRIWTNADTLAAQGGAIGQQVPDSARDIGWEVDFGISWKLLEGLTSNTTFAYWKPGNWWSYAYPNTANIYKNNRGAPIVTQTAANIPMATFNLGRDIDPLFAIETNILINF